MSGTVIVTGSRDWDNAEVLGRVLSAAAPDLLVEGGARGADKLARIWAASNCVAYFTVHADWDRLGKKAGAMRNIEMLELHPGALVIAFPLPQSRGTWHCVREARKRGHEVMVVETSGNWAIIT